MHLRVEDPFSPLKQKLEKLAVRLAVSKWRQKVEAYKVVHTTVHEHEHEHVVIQPYSEIWLELWLPLILLLLLLLLLIQFSLLTSYFVQLNKLEQDERGLEHGVRKSEKEPRTGIHVV